MKSVVVVGAQWGDEGKGKVVDYILAGSFIEYIVHIAGGHNAGHTVIIGKDRYVLQLIPCGILRPHQHAVIGTGVVIDPRQNLIGQIEGGADMGVGYPLREEYIAGKTKDWVTFKFPTMKTAFDMDTIIRETPRARGTLGATGVGEMAMTSTAPAVINAIKDACGIWIRELPATPEKINAALADVK